MYHEKNMFHSYCFWLTCGNFYFWSIWSDWYSTKVLPSKYNYCWMKFWIGTWQDVGSCFCDCGGSASENLNTFAMIKLVLRTRIFKSNIVALGCKQNGPWSSIILCNENVLYIDTNLRQKNSEIFITLFWNHTNKRWGEKEVQLVQRRKTMSVDPTNIWPKLLFFLSSYCALQEFMVTGM